MVAFEAGDTSGDVTVDATRPVRADAAEAIKTTWGITGGHCWAVAAKVSLPVGATAAKAVVELIVFVGCIGVVWVFTVGAEAVEIVDVECVGIAVVTDFGTVAVGLVGVVTAIGTVAVGLVGADALESIGPVRVF